MTKQEIVLWLLTVPCAYFGIIGLLNGQFVKGNEMSLLAMGLAILALMLRYHRIHQKHDIILRGFGVAVLVIWSLWGVFAAIDIVLSLAEVR